MQDNQPKPRLVWDGQKLTTAADIQIVEVEGVISRLQVLLCQLYQMKLGEVIQPPKSKLILPTK